MKEEIIHTFVVLAYKESKYLEECIKSVLDQEYKSKVVIATATPNEYINGIAKKYNLEVIENKNHKDIGGDFDFAIKCGKTPLVTLAHQDDIYDKKYSKEMVDLYLKYRDAIILFPNYYEIKGKEKEYDNVNLKIKRKLLRSLKNNEKNLSKKRKRDVLRFGDAIGCPSVTFNIDKIEYPVFDNGMICDVDWNAWERLSKLDGRFVYTEKFLMGHRIHEGSTTTEIIQDNNRTKEDYEILKRFWPAPIAFMIAKVYKNSEKNNNVNNNDKGKKK